MSTIESATSTENKVAQTENNSSTATATPVVKKQRKSQAKSAPKAPKEKVAILEVEETTPAKEKIIRTSKIDKVQSEVQKQFGISEVQFWKFVAKHKPGKMSANKFADSLVQKAFFEREKLAEQLVG